MAACSHQQEWGCNSNTEKQPKATTKGLLEVKEKEGDVGGGGDAMDRTQRTNTEHTLLLDPFQLGAAPGLYSILGSHIPVLVLPASAFSKRSHRANIYILNLS